MVSKNESVPDSFLRLVKGRLWKLSALPVGPEEAGTWWARLEALKVPGLQARPLGNPGKNPE